MVGAGQGNPGASDVRQPDGDVEALSTITVPARWASANANDLRSLIRSSDEVFFGRVTRVLGQRQANQPRGANSDRQGLPLTSFEITVASAVAGTVSPGAAVVIDQVGGTVVAPGGTRRYVVLEADQLLEGGAEYLFFADRMPDGNLTVPPFGRLEVGTDGLLEPLLVWSRLGALQELAGLSSSAAAARVGSLSK